MNPTLPLSLVVPVTVQINGLAPQTPTFNQGLIVGTSGVIPSVGGGSPRVRVYDAGNWSTEMLTDGFTINSSEYIAMSIYFAQSPQPQYGWVGAQDLTAIAALNFTAGHAGTGFAVGDTITVVQAGAQLGQAKVTTIGANGAVTGLQLIGGSQGTGYAIAGALATTTTGAGINLEVDITAIGETPLQAIIACRNASASWYGVTALAAVKADHVAIALYAQGLNPSMMYHFETADADVLTSATTDVFSVLKAASYNRAFGVYATTQGGVAPNNTYAAAATLGVAMGLNTGLAGSYFTMMFKTLIGIVTEPLNVGQVTTLKGKRGNAAVTYANGAYSFLQWGYLPNGQFYDEVLFLDVLCANIQYNAFNAFTSNPAISQNAQGQQILIGSTNSAAALLGTIGYISAGVWSGPTVLGLTSGTALPAGYLAQSQPFSAQSAGSQANREMMPVYLAIIEGQAGHSVAILVNVER